jgi:predicted MFS family arabinose efflux permease
MLTSRQLWWRIVPAFAAGYFLSYGLRTVNAVIAPELARDFAATASDLGLLTSAYFLAFGAFQLPLGLLLDRFGPRRVEAALLVVAAAGCALFGAASSIDGLVAGRALIGLGVSACLMASFKAFSQWFPLDRLPSLTGMIMVAGGLGALSTSVPVTVALPLIGWRGVFFLIAALNVAVAIGLIASVPDKPAATQEPLRAQLAALAGIFRSAAYWRFAPQGCLIVGGFMAVQGLWAVPWMMTMNDLPRGAAAEVLFMMGLAMLAGFLFVALASGPLARRGVSPMQLLTAGMGTALVVELAILLDLAPPMALWPILGLTFSLGNLAYSQLALRFPVSLSGRLSTALNLAMFTGAFLLQWGIGIAIEALAGGSGLSRPEAFRATFGALLAAQAASYLWFLKPDAGPRHDAVSTPADPPRGASAGAKAP